MQRDRKRKTFVPFAVIAMVFCCSPFVNCFLCINQHNASITRRSDILKWEKNIKRNRDNLHARLLLNTFILRMLIK